MKALSIDFGRRPRSMLYRVGCVVFGIGVVLMAHQAWRYAGYFEARKLLEAENSRLQHLVDNPVAPIPLPSASSSKEALERAAQVIERLNAPWAALFDSVEAAITEQVTLLGMDPDLQLRELRLRAEAKNVDAMLQFVRRIDKTGVLNGAYLDNYQLYLQDPQRPVRFTLVARWGVAEPKGEIPKVTTP